MAVDQVFVKDAGTWQQARAVYVKQAGVFDRVKTMWVKSAGAWVQVYGDALAFSVLVASYIGPTDWSLTWSIVAGAAIPGGGYGAQVKVTDTLSGIDLETVNDPLPSDTRFYTVDATREYTITLTDKNGDVVATMMLTPS